MALIRPGILFKYDGSNQINGITLVVDEVVVEFGGTDIPSVCIF